MLELLSCRRGARTNEVGQDNQRSSVNDKERPGHIRKWEISTVGCKRSHDNYMCSYIANKGLKLTIGYVFDTGFECMKGRCKQYKQMTDT